MKHSITFFYILSGMVKSNLNSAGFMCVYVYMCLYFSFFLLLALSNYYTTVYMWLGTFSGIRKGEILNLPYIVFHLKTYVCGKVIERNWEYFNEDTFINFCFFSFLTGRRKFSQILCWTEWGPRICCYVDWRNSIYT